MRPLFRKIGETVRLGFSLAKTNFKLRNEGNYLGVAWYLLVPLSLFVIILLVRHAAFSDTGIEHYPVYLLIGITGFNFFRQTISLSISAIHTNGGFIKSLNGISLEAFVLSQFIESVFSHAFELALVVGAMAYFGLPIAWVIFYPLVFLTFAPFVLGLSLLFAAGGTYMRDFENVWNIAGQLLFFATPIFYVARPESFAYSANLFNPLFYFLSMARDVMLYRTVPSLWMIATLFGAGIAVLFLGMGVFGKYKGRFSELV